jgi:hypothetical protein
LNETQRQEASDPLIVTVRFNHDKAGTGSSAIEAVSDIRMHWKERRQMDEL